jgi:hypothetical protein
MVSSQRRALSAAASLVIAALAGAPAGAAAQTVRGSVTDAETGAGVAGARVTLSDSAGLIVRQATTGAAGEFVLVAASAGAYLLGAALAGYQSLPPVTVVVGAEEEVELAVRLSRTVVLLEPLTVTARRRDTRHDATFEGALTRHAQFPHFGPRRVVMRDDVELRSSMHFSDVFNFFPPTRNCLILYWNGALVQSEEMATQWLQAPAVYLDAVEFYRNYSDAPQAYRRFPAYIQQPLQCSVAAMWPGLENGRERRPWLRFAGFGAVALLLLILAL